MHKEVPPYINRQIVRAVLLNFREGRAKEKSKSKEPPSGGTMKKERFRNTAIEQFCLRHFKFNTYFTLGEQLSLSVTQFSQLQKGDNNSRTVIIK